MWACRGRSKHRVMTAPWSCGDVHRDTRHITSALDKTRIRWLLLHGLGVAVVVGFPLMADLQRHFEQQRKERHILITALDWNAFFPKTAGCSYSTQCPFQHFPLYPFTASSFLTQSSLPTITILTISMRARSPTFLPPSLFRVVYHSPNPNKGKQSH